MNFNELKVAVAAQFERMQKYPLFRMDVHGDIIWAAYMAAFPEGSDPIFRKRTEHDCGCCRNFIRTVGNVVAYIDGALVSVWDIKVPKEPAYEVVARSLSTLVKGTTISRPFLHYEPKVGTEKNFEQMVGGSVKTWNHFFVNVKREFVVPKKDIPSRLNDLGTARAVLHRSLTGEVIGGVPVPVVAGEEEDTGGAITMEAVNTVLDLIAQNSIYRGAEQKFAVEEFKKLLTKFNALPEGQKTNFAWTASQGQSGSVARIRNTSVGKLLVDISADVDLEVAVKKFESKVAPHNYKRSTALVTKAMIEKAKVTVGELGLTSALERRYATIHDISINNILFADRAARKVINGDVFDDLASATTGRVSSKALDKIEEVTIDSFITNILPRVDSIEVLVENQHKSNLVSLIAPADPTASQLFKWDNRFSWSYNGEVADAIKERVKKAGGNVEGDLCCRLAWSNYDDLDFHMVEPNGAEISFRNRRSTFSGGMLDVDMNAGRGESREPVENIFFSDRRKMAEGNYRLYVHNFAKRETKDVGFQAQIDYLGTVYNFDHPKSVPDGEKITVAKFMYTHKDGLTITESLPSTTGAARGEMVWGIPTQTYHKVNVMMLSPNFWDEKQVGNKHFFFMLEGCKNDGTARGFFNEFLRSDLDQHRKVMEMVGSKMRLENADEQLSGLGFSSTAKNTLVCRVKGSFTRTIKIVF